MQAIRQIKKTQGNKVTVNLPDNFKSVMVEVIVLPLEASKSKHVETGLKPASPESARQSLLAYLDTLGTKGRKKRTKKDIDREIAAERNSWG
jgi:hypothetical protein